MVNIYCDCGELMEQIEEDSRQEWYEETVECPVCEITKIHRMEFSQNGLVELDEIKETNEV